jgi:hypothetical protein
MRLKNLLATKKNHAGKTLLYILVRWKEGSVCQMKTVQLPR